MQEETKQTPMVDIDTSGPSAEVELKDEAQTEEQVRRYLKNRNFNIEFVTKLEGTHLEYEKQSDHFNVEQAE